MDTKRFLNTARLEPMQAGQRFHLSAARAGILTVTTEIDPDIPAPARYHLDISTQDDEGSTQFIAGLSFPIDAEVLDETTVVFDEGTALPTDDVDESLTQAAGLIRSILAASRHV